MEYLINLPEIENDKLKLVLPKFFGKTKLFYNDIEVEKAIKLTTQWRSKLTTLCRFKLTTQW